MQILGITLAPYEEGGLSALLSFRTWVYSGVSSDLFRSPWRYILGLLVLLATPFPPFGAVDLGLSFSVVPFIVVDW